MFKGQFNIFQKYGDQLGNFEIYITNKKFEIPIDLKCHLKFTQFNWIKYFIKFL